MITKEQNLLGFIFQSHEDALCDEDETMDERIAVIEDVLCELDERINGGE
jgi:hypothetical protein